MARRVTATFSSREAANRAADALVDLGADRDYISTLQRGDTRAADGTARPHADHMVEPARQVGDSGAALTTTDEHDTAQGAAVGAGIGAVVGIAAGLASMMVPGLGLVTAGGALAWALGGVIGTAAAGAVAGGVYGSLRDIGIDEAHARHYEERVRGGDVLMTAVVPDMIEEGRIRSILDEQGAQYVTFTQDISTWAPSMAAAGTSAIDSRPPSVMDQTMPLGQTAARPASDYVSAADTATPSTTNSDTEFIEEEEEVETRRM